MKRTVFPRGGRWSGAIALLLALAVLAPLVAGTARAQERIVGGEPAPPDAMPFMAAIWRTGEAKSPVCDGTLIARQNVLTAASCLYDITRPDETRPWSFRQLEPAEIAVSFAANDGTVTGSRRLRVAGIAINPRFRFGDCFLPDSGVALTCHDDAAVLRLADSPRGREPVALASAGADAFTHPGREITAAGWSGDRALARRPGPLTRAAVPVARPSLCAHRYEGLNGRYGLTPPVRVDGKGTFCAYRVSAGPCHSEAGSPALANRGGAWLQVGILGPVLVCSEARWPYVYARVSEPSMNHWILQTAGLAAGKPVKGEAK